MCSEGDIRIIRPLLYCRESLTRAYAKAANLPVILENCPGCFESPKERARIHALLAEQEVIHPRLFSSLEECMKPLFSAENNKYLESCRTAARRGDSVATATADHPKSDSSASSAATSSATNEFDFSWHLPESRLAKLNQSQMRDAIHHLQAAMKDLSIQNSQEQQMRRNAETELEHWRRLAAPNDDNSLKPTAPVAVATKPSLS